MSNLEENPDTPIANFIANVQYQHLLAGVSGGVLSTLILHPFDLIKIRFAVNDGHTTKVPAYTGIFNAFVTIARTEGVRGLYKGVLPNIWGSGTSWGLYFLFYNTIKIWMQPGVEAQPLGPILHMVAAAEAGLLTLVLTNPIWVVKTRLCLQYHTSDAPSTNRARPQYTGMIHALRSIYRDEGFRGLYRGFLPGVFGVSHGALQFMAYEEMKKLYNQYYDLPYNNKLQSTEYLVFAAASKLFAATTTYPYQVVRARLQDINHSYEGVWDCMRQTWKFESWRGFYKGLGASLLRVTPATMITFWTYETVVQMLMEPRTPK